MRFAKVILIMLLAFAPVSGWSVIKAQFDPAKAEAAGSEEAHGLPAKSAIIYENGFFAISNSMVITIFVTIGIVIFAQSVSRNVKPVPTGAANFAEWMVESLYNFLGNILGADLVKRTFWFFASIFIFILVTNWIGLLPGVGTVGWGHTDEAGHFHLVRPLLRGGNADLNMTSAMALLFCVLWIFWALQSNGPVGFFKHIFAPKGETKGWLVFVLVPIFFFVGILEVMSIAFRPVSLSFRLYGNIFAGENILDAMMNIVPALSWIIPLPFYFLELLVGFVQALVFMLLTAVFTLLICSHEGHDEHDHDHGHEETALAKH